MCPGRLLCRMWRGKVLVVVPPPDAARVAAQRAGVAARVKGGAERGAGGAALGVAGVFSVRGRQRDVSPVLPCR